MSTIHVSLTRIVICNRSLQNTFKSNEIQSEPDYFIKSTRKKREDFVTLGKLELSMDSVNC